MQSVPPLRSIPQHRFAIVLGSGGVRSIAALGMVTSALTNNLMQARLAEAHGGGARLLSIVPKLGQRVGLFDTEAMPYLVDAGRRATEAALPSILALLQRAPQLAAA